MKCVSFLFFLIHSVIYRLFREFRELLYKKTNRASIVDLEYATMIGLACMNILYRNKIHKITTRKNQSDTEQLKDPSGSSLQDLFFT